MDSNTYTTQNRNKELELKQQFVCSLLSVASMEILKFSANGILLRSNPIKTSYLMRNNSEYSFSYSIRIQFRKTINSKGGMPSF